MHQPQTPLRAGGGTGAPRGVEGIYLELRERICLLRYPPGEMLSENALAEEFGVSRTPIRQALQRLEYEGLVVSRHGVGTMVTTVDLRYLKQVYALRLKLIDVIAEMSPGRVTENDVRLLEGVLDEVRALGERRDPGALGRLYTRFSDELSRAIGNEPLREIADRLFYQTNRVWLQILPEMDWGQEVDAVIDELTRVLDALRSGDMRSVAEVRREHMVLCLGRLNDYLGEPLLALA